MGSWYTDTIQKDPRFMSVKPILDPNLLFPPFRQKIDAIIAEAKAQGHIFQYGETYRSKQRQTDLFRRGLTRLRNVGVHHYGLAVDLHWMKNGEFEQRGDLYYPILFPLCVKHKLVYGADWGDPPPSKHSFNDWDHVQMVGLVDQPNLFLGAWYPGLDWVPKQIG
jgi:hypothetical protein